MLATAWTASPSSRSRRSGRPWASCRRPERPGRRRARRTEEWAELQPDNPEPRIALLDLAIAAGDEAAIRAEVEALKDVGGPRGHYWRLARVEDLLRDRPGGRPARGAAARRGRPPDQGDRGERPAAAARLPARRPADGAAARDRRGDRRLREGHRPEGGAGRAEPAGGPARPRAARRRARADPREGGRLAPEVERLATVQALKAGDKDRAEQLAAQIGRRATPRGSTPGSGRRGPQRPGQAQGGRGRAAAPDRAAARRADPLAPAPDAPGRPEAA